MRKSKALHAFERRLDAFNDDIELVDILRSRVIGGVLSEDASEKILSGLEPSIHIHLSRRRNSQGSRTIIANHLRNTVYSSYVKDVYEELTNYLRTILVQAAKKGADPGRLIGEHSFKADAKTVFELGSWPKVCQWVSESIFQSLETERSTLKLLQKMANKLALTIDPARINSALPYLEVRHFLVHADGALPSDFTQQYPYIPHRSGNIDLNYEFILNFRREIKALVRTYDQEIVRNQLLADADIQPLRRMS